jgi:hypothetical protein
MLQTADAESICRTRLWKPTPLANGGVERLPPTLRKKREGWGAPGRVMAAKSKPKAGPPANCYHKMKIWSLRDFCSRTVLVAC